MTGAVVRLGMAARFSRLKRHDLLIGMLGHLERLVPRTAFRLSLAGSGETLEALQAQARRLGVAIASSSAVRSTRRGSPNGFARSIVLCTPPTPRS